MRRLVVAFSSLAVVVLLGLPALAAPFDPSEMVFPVDGDYRLTDSFGDCRGTNCSRSHEGVDIPADKGVPVVAVADGVVTSWISKSGPSVYLSIDHGDGWSTRYIHLNNDTENGDGSYSDDGQGVGVAPGIEAGTPVEAGQLIGWVGDSGNAEATISHLHFELRKSAGSQWESVPVDPYPYLVNAAGAWDGVFRDDDGDVHEANIDKIAEWGITLGCNPPLNNEFCPYRLISRGEMAAFISRALNLNDEAEDLPYTDVEGTLFETAIRRIEAAGIAFGCTETEFCPNAKLLRSEMAELLVRAFGYTNPDETDFFVDDDGNQFEDSINALANHRITLGCNPPDNTNFCPDRTLFRAEMATFFVRALEG